MAKDKDNIEKARGKVDEAYANIDFSSAESARQTSATYRESLQNLGREIGKGSDKDKK